jgi:hypothetical protein
MERHTFPVAVDSLVLLIATVSFPALRSQSNSSVLAASQSASPQQVRNVLETRAPDSCPVTKPRAHAFVPPSPYPTALCSDGLCASFWFGTPKLWTARPADGRDGLRQKRLWWREGYDWHHDQEPALRITGVRLDSSDRAVVLSERANAGWTSDKNHPFIVDVFDVPAPGCWKMTARYKDGKLSFVVWVRQ